MLWRRTPCGWVHMCKRRSATVRADSGMSGGMRRGAGPRLAVRNIEGGIVCTALRSDPGTDALPAAVTTPSVASPVTGGIR